MPIYEYKCEKCGAGFEELVFDDKNPPCPECGSGETDKMMSCACVRTGDGGGSGGGGGCCSCSGGNCGSCGH